MYGTYIHKKYFLICIFALANLLFATSCTGNNKNSFQVSDVPSNSPTLNDEVLINTNEFSSIISVSTTDSVYVLQEDYSTGNYNIHYIDFKNNYDTCLCSSLNCKHNDDSCTSFIPANCGGAMLACNGDQLIEIILGNTIDIPAQIYTMNKDGHNKKLIKTFSPNQSIVYGYTISYILSNNKIYLMIENCITKNNEVNIENELIGVSLTDGDVSSICKLDNPSFFVGVMDNKIITKELLGLDNSVNLIDPFTGVKDTLMTYSSGYTLPFESENKLYMLDFKTHTIYEYDTPDTPIANFDFDGSNSLSKIRAISNSKIIVDNSCITFANGDYKREDSKYCIDYSSNEVQESSINIDKNGKLVLPWIYGIVDDKLLVDVRCTIDTISEFNPQTGGIEPYEIENIEYGIINISDLFSNTFTYIPVQ